MNMVPIRRSNYEYMTFPGLLMSLVQMHVTIGMALQSFSLEDIYRQKSCNTNDEN